jgi:thiamine pyrophosphokinase
MHMESFLFIGGEGPAPSAFLPFIAPGDFIACADSGLDLALKAGLKPDLVLGDLDSTQRLDFLKDFPAERLVRVRHEKDETDTELGLSLLKEGGHERVSLVGGGNGRLDHFIAVYELFQRPETNLWRWFAPTEWAEVLSGRLSYACAPKERLSVFPLGPETLRLKSFGLKWPLEGLSFQRGHFGISNESLANKVELEVLSGRALLIREYPRPTLDGKGKNL